MANNDKLLGVFYARAVEQDGAIVLTVPEREIKRGTIEQGLLYRVGLLPSVGMESRRPSTQTNESRRGRDRALPVNEGDILELEIQDIDEKGDGVARTKYGYNVVVPGTEIGDRVTVEVTEVRTSFVFADVVDRSY